MIEFISKLFKNLKEEKYKQKNIEMYNFYMMRKHDIITDMCKKHGYFPVTGREYVGMVEIGTWNGLKVHYRCISIKKTNEVISQMDYIIHSIDGLPPMGGLTFRQFMDKYGHLQDKLARK